MIDYYITDDNGDVVSTGTCHKNHPRLNWSNVHIGKVEQTVNYNIEDLRRERNQLLKDTDWTQIPDAPLSDEMKNRYKQYRQALRDLPQNYGTINELSDVTFPTIEDF